VHLVERTSQGARLTPAGEILADGARDILSGLASLPDKVKSRQGEVSGRVRLGTTDSIGIYVLPPLLAKFVEGNPRIDVQVVCQSSPQLMAMLLDDELDVAIGTTEHPKLTCERLYQNPLVLCFPKTMPVEKVPTSVKELAAHRIVTFDKGLTIRNLIDQAFAKNGLTFQPAMSLANVEVIKAMVKAGLGLGIIPDGCVADDGIQTRPIRDLNVARTVRLMYRPQNQAMSTARMVEWLRKLRQP